MSARIAFWQPVLTDHSVHTFAAAARALGSAPVAFVAARELAFRREQGWTDASAVMPTHIVGEADGARMAERMLADPHVRHVFGSPFERGPIAGYLAAAAARGRETYLVSEPYMTAPVGYNDDRHPLQNRVKAWLRPIAWRRHAARLTGSVTGVFAISPLAVSQFGRLGYRAIFPFGYFLPPRQAPEPKATSAGPLKLAYVGSMIRRKNVGTLLAAMREAPGGIAKLDIFGSTPAGFDLDDQPNVRIAGRIPFGTTRDVLTGYDALVIPSLHDGWGMVVNEAIEAGCAVIASHQTGASVLVESWQCGSTFPAHRADLLAQRIVELARELPRLDAARANARRMAPFLSSEIAGQYMAACIAAPASAATPAPWYD